MATILYKGLGIEKDHPRARAYLERSSQSFALAKYNLAVMLKNGEGGEKDELRAQQLMEEASYGYIYFASKHLQNGGKTPFVSFEELVNSSIESAINGNMIGYASLGYLTFYGIGLEAHRPRGSELLLTAAKRGNAAAQFLIGTQIYAKLDKTWLEASYQNDYPPAIHRLAFEHELGIDYPADPKRSRALYSRAVELGHTPSINNLGLIYQNGLGGEKDMSEALALFKQAAGKGSAAGMTNLAQSYRNGLEVDKNLDTAMEWYRKAIDAGSSAAGYYAATMCANGELGYMDWKQAAVFYKTAAKKGNWRAMIKLGDCYRDGKGIAASKSNAMSWYERARVVNYHENEAAAYRIALLQLKRNWIGSAPSEAFASLKKLSKQGHAPATFQLGLLYRDGIEVKQSDKKAFSKFVAAAKAGPFDIENSLGKSFKRFYSKPEKLRQRPPEWTDDEAIFKQAGLNAAYQIGNYIIQGTAMRKQPELGIAWIELSAKHGHAPSQFLLGKLLLDGQFTAKDLKQGWDLIASSASDGHTDAQYFLGLAFFEGHEGAPLEEPAIDWLKRAAAQSHDASIRLLHQHGIDFETRDAPKDEFDPNKIEAPLPATGDLMLG